ncbi:uncharacterized protein LOC135499831 isoform X2 [Lineus longissimus]|uniref:uncharacterized protein LOC135499831 isoform X2 n=1 Tax=Lineus longissimus TaxID=88925 RepID=UPI002B4C74C9
MTRQAIIALCLLFAVTTSCFGFVHTLLGGCDDIEKDFKFEKSLREKCNRDLEEANQKAADADDVKRQLVDCQNSGKKLKNDIEKLKKEKDYLKGEATEYENLLIREQTECRKKDKRCKAGEAQLQQTQSNLTECEDKLIDCGGTQSIQATKHVEFLKGQINDLKKHRDQLDLELEDTQTSFRNLRYTETICQSNYSDLVHQLSEYKNRIQSLQNENQASQKTVGTDRTPYSYFDQHLLLHAVAVILLLYLATQNNSLKESMKHLERLTTELEKDKTPKEGLRSPTSSTHAQDQRPNENKTGEAESVKDQQSEEMFSDDDTETEDNEAGHQKQGAENAHAGEPWEEPIKKLCDEITELKSRLAKLERNGLENQVTVGDKNGAVNPTPQDGQTDKGAGTGGLTGKTTDFDADKNKKHSDQKAKQEAAVKNQNPPSQVQSVDNGEAATESRGGGDGHGADAAAISKAPKVREDPHSESDGVVSTKSPNIDDTSLDNDATATAAPTHNGSEHLDEATNDSGDDPTESHDGGDGHGADAAAISNSPEVQEDLHSESDGVVSTKSPNIDDTSLDKDATAATATAAPTHNGSEHLDEATNDSRDDATESHDGGDGHGADAAAISNSPEVQEDLHSESDGVVSTKSPNIDDTSLDKDAATATAAPAHNGSEHQDEATNDSLLKEGDNDTGTRV